MRFVNPAFLFALSAISIPVIIHLFNFRKFKTVYFTNVRFLKEIKEETQAKSELKHLLILFARILSIACLVLAFAQPYLPYNNQKVSKGNKVLSVYLDNSFSMDAENKSGGLLDEARKDARELAAAYKASDRFQLLTNDFEGRQQRLLSRDEFLERVEEVKLSPASRKLSKVFARQADILNSAGSVPGTKQAFIISDFQKSISDFEQIHNDTSIAVRLLPVEAQERKNLYIDSCWFETPVRKLNQAQALHIRLRNISAQDYSNVPMKLFINGQQKTPSSFSIAANSKTDTVISFTLREPGWQQGRVEITDSPITFDDTYYFSFEITRSISVLCISPALSSGAKLSIGPSPVSTLFEKDSAFQYTSVLENAIDYSSIVRNQLIILNGLDNISSGLSQELSRYVHNGGSLLVFPSRKIDAGTYDSFLNAIHVSTFGSLDTASSKVEKLNFEHELYREGVFDLKKGKRSGANNQLDLPNVYEHYRISHNSRSSEEQLMSLRNGDTFLAKYSFGSGSVYLCSSSLTTSASNFTKHALFVPTLLQIAFFSRQQNRLSYTIGNDESIELGGSTGSSEQVFHILSEDSKFDIIPEHRYVDSKTIIYEHNQLKESGNYRLLAGKSVLAGLSFNYNRSESDISTEKSEELKGMVDKNGFRNFSLIEHGRQSLTAMLAEADLGKKLWKEFILLALLFLAAEVALIRFLK
jgi:hypothetical protein